MSDGTSVTVPRGGVVVFVGPNNAGKSVALRDIATHVGRDGFPPRAVKTLELDKVGSEDDLFAWLDEHATQSRDDYGRYQKMGRGSAQTGEIRHYWQHGPPFGGLGGMLTFYATGENRLGAAHGHQNIDYETQTPSGPLHFLFMDPELEKRISDVSLRAFGQPLVLDTQSGMSLYLRLGEAPPLQTGPSGRPSREYQEALRSLPVLDEQGDGMKSFMGLALNIIVSVDLFVLVDEPEAFLHPPQARLLGRLLADEKGEDAQVFVATHDSDILTGLLSSSADITIVRLTRDGDVNRTSPLDPEKVRELWDDPILRYSNVLDGLFHEAVVLCESDADCRFYNAVLDATEIEEDADPRSPQLLFTHCGGKHRMPTVAAALTAVSVPVKVVADFDVLREKNLLQKLVGALSGDWSTLEDHWTTINKTLNAATHGPSVEYVRENVTKTLDGVTGTYLDKSDVEAIRKYTKSEYGWDGAKRDGKTAVPRGDAAASLERLLPALQEIGLFVVPVGEMEGFAPTVGGHGPDWVNTVLERGLHRDGSLPRARDFVQAVAESSLKA